MYRAAIRSPLCARVCTIRKAFAMTLAQVQGTFGLIAFLIATWAGLIIAIALLLPKHASRSEISLSETPLKSFFTGLLMLIPGAISLGLLRSPSGGAKLLGFLALSGVGAAIAIGAAGLATLMGRRISEMAEARSDFGTLVRGSVIYSLALGFPFIGWFVFLPISLVLAMGAGVRGILRNSPSIIANAAPEPPSAI